MTTSRRLAASSALAAAFVMVSLAAPSRAAESRAFRAQARVFPVELAPGRNNADLPVRPVSAEAAAANPPASSFGRAALVDLGTTEAQIPPPEESYAHCDTGSPNVPDEQTRQVGPIDLAARCSEAPASTTTATVLLAAVAPSGASGLADALSALGVGGGTTTSTAEADGSGAVPWASADATLTDLHIGAIRIDGAHFTARVEASGQPGEARTDLALDVVGATIADVPVTIGSGGVQVDDAKLALPFLAQAAATVNQALGQLGLIDVRVLEPRVTVAEDGSSVELDGGGLTFVTQTSTDPADRYFVGVTLLGAHLSVLVGGAVTDGAPAEAEPAGPPINGTPPPAPPAQSTRPSGEVPAATQPPTETAAPGLDVTATNTRRLLARPATWWLVVLLVGEGTVALAALSSTPPLRPVRRRAVGWWDLTAERFLRG